MQNNIPMPLETQIKPPEGQTKKLKLKPIKARENCGPYPFSKPTTKEANRRFARFQRENQQPQRTKPVIFHIKISRKRRFHQDHNEGFSTPKSEHAQNLSQSTQKKTTCREDYKTSSKEAKPRRIARGELYFG
ncbi:hypothetical protein Drorol1_Dr00008707 [Drosera rotundifolia]